MKTELSLGVVGTGISTIGTVAQTNEVLQTISLVLTICGAIISFIVIPLLNWYSKAKQDGKIDKKEIDEGVKTLKDGIDKVNDATKKGKKEK